MRPVGSQRDELARQVEHERRLRSLDRFLAAFESEHGEISDEELRAATARAHRRAVVVRGAGDQELA